VSLSRPTNVWPGRRKGYGRNLLSSGREPTRRDLFFHRLADGVGFEPTIELPRCRFSRPVPSTARPPIRHSALHGGVGHSRRRSHCRDRAAMIVSRPWARRVGDAG
jgi:hypothetical protein